MSYYRRRNPWKNWDDNTPKKVTVLITWDQVTNAAYKLKFDGFMPKKTWDEKVYPIIQLIKTSIPSSQREYDPDTKTWYIGESFITGIKNIVDAIPEFNVVFTEKPAEVTAQRMHSKEDDYAEFKRLLQLAHININDGLSLNEATKSYRRAAMYLHPDRSPQMAEEMSRLNEVWSRLKVTYWKVENASI